VEDLEKCLVFDEQGREIGKVLSSYQTKAQVVLCLQLKDGRIQDVPFLPVYFPQIDIAQAKLVVRLPREV
jgi:ribosomal 30S subunit maturation factor RimM